MTYTFDHFGLLLLNRRLDQSIESAKQQADLAKQQINERLSRIERQLEAIFKPIFPPR